MWIYYYEERKTGKLIGYHTSTLCTISPDENRAKKYRPKTPEEVESQRQVILQNFKTVIESTPEKPGFLSLPLTVKDTCWEGYTFEDVELKPKELVEPVETSNQSKPDNSISESYPTGPAWTGD